MEIPIAELPFEKFKQLIDSGAIQEEIPFDLLATHYPQLLSKWYPGYPGAPRFAKEGDPFSAQAIVKNRKMILDIPGMENSPVTLEDNVSDGRYDVWLMKEDSGQWCIYGSILVSNMNS